MNFLPPERTSESAPFERVGVDLFGPFEVKIGASTRSRSSTIKMWGCIFTCLTSRAAHIEPLDSANTSSFINAFRRFCAIRGQPSLIISDRGGNFVGASKVLSSGIDMEAVEVRLRGCGITWQFNPPHASHFGGVWERVIGSARRVMDGMLKELHGKTLDRDSLITMFAEASRVINTTPLWTTSWETEEPASLSPADLLMINQYEGHHDYSATERDLLMYGRRRDMRAQYLVQCFRKRWDREYLTTMHQRSKWFRKIPIDVGDIVLMVDEDKPRISWPLGAISKIFRGADGLVRSVVIKIGGNTPKYYERPINKTISILHKRYQS